MAVPEPEVAYTPVLDAELAKTATLALDCPSTPTLPFEAPCTPTPELDWPTTPAMSELDRPYTAAACTGAASARAFWSATPRTPMRGLMTGGLADESPRTPTPPGENPATPIVPDGGLM